MSTRAQEIAGEDTVGVLLDERKGVERLERAAAKAADRAGRARDAHGDKLARLTSPQLRAYAQARGVRGVTSARKGTILERLGHGGRDGE